MLSSSSLAQTTTRPKTPTDSSTGLETRDRLFTRMNRVGLFLVKMPALTRLLLQGAPVQEGDAPVRTRRKPFSPA
jgi:hypothetical protein